jgi:integrase/recombinase XerD
MSRPFSIRVVGPLEPYVRGFLDELARQGYAPWSATSYLGLMGHLSRWLRDHDLAAAELTSQLVQDFLEERRAHGYAKGRSAHGMMRVLTVYLRGIGAMPAVAPSPPNTPLERLLEEFASYLVNERGLAERTIGWYRHVAGLFLSVQSWNGSIEVGGELEGLTADSISRFVLAETKHRSAVSLGNVTVALRALLRFLYVQSLIRGPLAAAVPAAPGWRDGGTSRALEEGQVVRLLESCDRSTASGCRDFAILTILSRLGLRAGEVATLALDDVDWRSGEILVVAGKGHRHDRLPLPVDVGEALADYCRRARPPSSCRALFLHVRAPHTALSSDAVTHIVGAACFRAGLPRVGAHRLRHSAATAMRRAGAPLFEIGQVLRHRHAVTTALYAKDDRDALATVARRWPGGGA